MTKLPVILLALSASGTASVVSAQPGDRQPHTFLRKHIGFSDQDFRELEAGGVVTKTLDTNVKNEVAIFGAVWVDALVDDFVKLQLDIERFEKGDAVQGIQKLSDPPVLSDFVDLRLPEEDLEAIPKCRVGKCAIKIDEDTLLRLQSEVDWSRPDAHDRASRLIRQMALEGSEAYLENGDGALGFYRDKKRPTHIETEFDGLLENSAYLLEYVPEFHTYLDDFPNAELPGSESFLYWSRVQFGLRPTVRLSHVVIYPLNEGKNASVLVGSKMLYATHYFHTALELKALIRDTARQDPRGFYLISLNRSRSDGLTGLFGGIVRRAALGEAVKSLESFLALGKQQLESSTSP